MSPIDLRNPGRPIRVGVILFNTLTEHLDVAPVGFFSSISREFLKTVPQIPDELKKGAPDFTFHWVNEDGKTPGKLTGNMETVPTDSFASCPPLDIAIVGAMSFNYQPTEAEIAFLRKTHDDCTALLLVCAGFQPALVAGLLEGKTATAPRPFLATMKQSAPGVNWIQKRYVRDGKIWTTGSLLNGFDMVAAFGRESWGGEGTVVDVLTQEGAWPDRDVDYKDIQMWDF